MKNFKKWSIALSFLSGFFYFIPFLFPSFFFLSWFALVPTPSCYSRTILQKGLFFRLDLWKFGSNSGNLLDGKSESAALGVWVSIELSIFIDFWHWKILDPTFLFFIILAAISGFHKLLFHWLRKNIFEH